MCQHMGMLTRLISYDTCTLITSKLLLVDGNAILPLIGGYEFPWVGRDIRIIRTLKIVIQALIGSHWLCHSGSHWRIGISFGLLLVDMNSWRALALVGRFKTWQIYCNIYSLVEREYYCMDTLNTYHKTYWQTGRLSEYRKLMCWNLTRAQDNKGLFKIIRLYVDQKA